MGSRNLAGLTGTKYGCGVGLCGSCTVHVNGKAARSCQVTLGDVEGATVTAIEGLHPDGNNSVHGAWRDLNVPLCGVCQTGQIMQAAWLLNENPGPSDAEILGSMSGNVCRCGCYQRIVDHAMGHVRGPGRMGLEGARDVGAHARVQWTREDDVRHSFQHTTSAERVEVALDDEGRVSGWLHRSVAPSILSTFAPTRATSCRWSRARG